MRVLKHRRTHEPRRRRPERTTQTAAADLRYIREAMQESARFTDVPGWGMVLIGLTAIIATLLAASESSEGAWLRVWTVEAVVALAIAVLSILHKTRVTGIPLRSGPTRKFFLGLAPPLLVGAMLTVVLQREGLVSVLPGTWLLLYGAAFVGAGAYAMRIVPLLGACLMAAGVVALFGPTTWNDFILGLGFGGLHIGFGLVIARRYGG
jgi:hypothetical protein